MNSPFKHRYMAYLFKFCHSTLQWQPKRDPRWPAMENRGVLRISKWVSHFSLSWCLGFQFYSITKYLPFSQCQHSCRAAAGRNELTCSSTHTEKHTYNLKYTEIHMWVCLSSSVKARTWSSLLPHLMCEKWKEIKAHFLHSGQCGLWFPGARGARLAVKYCWACRVWEVYGAPRVAKNNRGKCWSKAPTAGKGTERWSKN